MKKVNKYSVPESWNDVTTEMYDKMFVGLDEYESETEKSVKLISNILNVDFDEVVEMPVPDIQNIIDTLKFLSTKITDESSFTVLVDDVPYQILPPNEMTYRQYINVEQESAKKYNVVKFIANAIVACDTKKYVPDNEYLIEWVKAQPITKIYPLINALVDAKKS